MLGSYSFPALRRVVGSCVRKAHTVPPWFVVSEEVQHARATGLPVVALESTIITHGLPPPGNLTAARQFESYVRQGDCLPATIAFLAGKCYVGLSDAQLTELAESKTVRKLSRADVAAAVCSRASGGTTVAATMLLSHLAGIQVFATGGLGGVHRDCQSTLDVSADVAELGRTPVAVVCAGVKAILDIPATLEMLETAGVPVCSLHPEGDFPAFWSRSSGLQAPIHVRSCSEVAELIRAHFSVCASGVVVANPVPPDIEIPKLTMDIYIAEALQAASAAEVTGKQVTPFLLSHLAASTSGTSVNTNLRLVRDNIRVACKVATALSPCEGEGKTSRKPSRTRSTIPTPKAVVFGGATVDIATQSYSEELVAGGTHDGSVRLSAGGVARNIADAMTRLSLDTLLVSAVGEDHLGSVLRGLCGHMNQRGFETASSGVPTTVFSVLLDPEGSCKFIFGQTQALEELSSEVLLKYEADIAQSSFVLVDGNMLPWQYSVIHQMCVEHKKPIVFEPADVNKVLNPLRIDQSWKDSRMQLVTPNMAEFCLMVKHLTGTEIRESAGFEEVVSAGRSLVEFIPHIMLKIGANGVIMLQRSPGSPLAVNQPDVAQFTAFHLPIAPGNCRVVSVMGGGDCLVATALVWLSRGEDLQRALQAGQLAASLAVQGTENVPNEIATLTTDLVISRWGAITPTNLLKVVHENYGEIPR